MARKGKVISKAIMQEVSERVAKETKTNQVADVTQHIVDEINFKNGINYRKLSPSERIALEHEYNAMDWDYDSPKKKREAQQLEKMQQGGGVYDRLYRGEDGKLHLKPNDFSVNNKGTGQSGHKSRTTKEQWETKQKKIQDEIDAKSKNRVIDIDEAYEQAIKENITRDVYTKFNQVAKDMGYSNAKEAEKFINNDLLDEAAATVSETRKGKRMIKKSLKGPTVMEKWRNNRQQKTENINQAYNTLYGTGIDITGAGGKSKNNNGAIRKPTTQNGSGTGQEDDIPDILDKGFLKYAGDAVNWATQDLSHAIAVAGATLGIGVLGAELLDEN